MLRFVDIALVVCLGLTGCKKDKPTDPVDSQPTDSEHNDSEEHHQPYVEGPAFTHERPSEGLMCFDCHICATNEAPAMETTHYVCNDCHTGPNGEVTDEAVGQCGCGDLDCSTTAPTLGCNGCHTDGTNGYDSAEFMNLLCEHCHENQLGP